MESDSFDLVIPFYVENGQHVQNIYLRRTKPFGLRIPESSHITSFLFVPFHLFRLSTKIHNTITKCTRYLRVGFIVQNFENWKVLGSNTNNLGIVFLEMKISLLGRRVKLKLPYRSMKQQKNF